ncbi:MAG: pyridoxal phosphate-dependent aminotransferase [Calditrichaeota bacterium]|nr:MAG: pyridoxal phosphate-dependent aminotransferase [Calditrichota bacterium]
MQKHRWEASAYSRSIEGSRTLAVTAKVAELKRQGVEVIALGAGEPDFPTPEKVCEAGIQAIRDGHTKYTPNAGIFELRKAIAQFLQSLGCDYAAEDILVCNGAKQAIYNALLATVDEGDEVLLPVPYWTSYPEQIKMARGRCVLLPTEEKDHFKINGEVLRRAITPRSRVLILNSPSNPTGMVYTRQELQQIAEIIYDQGLLVISDEIYLKLIYSDVETASMGSFAEIRDQVLLVNGLSKSHSMTGWRLGYLAAKPPFIQAAMKIQSHVTSNASSISQYAALAALKMPESELDKMREAFRQRRDYVVGRLQQMPGLSCLKPDGAFYVFPNVENCLGKSFERKTLQSPMDLTSYLLEQARVAVVPGEAFGSEKHIRISYATSMKNLQEAMNRIEKALAKLS